MESKLYKYHLEIKREYLDSLGHMNNAMYLTLYEQARWEILTQNNYIFEVIKKSGLGPVILEINIKFFKEILVGDKIEIVTYIESYEDKIAIIKQKMLRGTEVCSTASFTSALFNTKTRKIIPPTDEWLQAIGLDKKQVK